MELYMAVQFAELKFFRITNNRTHMKQGFAKPIAIFAALAALFPAALFANEDAPEHPDYVLSEWNEKERLPPLLDGIETPADWEKRAEAIRKKWIDYIGGVPERVPVRATVISETEEKDHLRQEIVYDT